VFEGVEETLYIDDCCHFNVSGMQRVAEAITREILAED
jgi:lysophospholipase L1-like esterase